MITLGSTAYGMPAYGIKTLYLDTEEDFNNLPTDCAVGSIAYIIESSKLYMINSKKEWVLQAVAGGNIKPPVTHGGAWKDMNGTVEDPETQEVPKK